MTQDAAVIFDVDGVLLDLTAKEEDGFFLVFEKRYGLTGLSRDWDSYRTRNDEDIIDEILETHGLPLADRPAIVADYVAVMEDWLARREFAPVEIEGARRLIESLDGSYLLGTATANLIAAARLRLAALDLWQPLARHAFGAEGGGHKREILARAIAATGLPRNRIVYIGDNLSDVDAGLSNRVHFIGFSTSLQRRARLAHAGAAHTAGDHLETRRLITAFIG